MAHDHDFSQENRNAYYLNQLFTIAVCGALGGVTVMLWTSGKLRFLVVERFWLPTLLGGIALLALVIIRAIALWRSVDQSLEAGQQHDHEHEHCGHEHEHCGHDHGHGHDQGHHDHDHGWAPWRYVVLLFPVVLYFLHLPNEGFSAGYGDRLKDIQLDVSSGLSADKGEDQIGFKELQEASLSPESRDYWEGRTIHLIGQYSDVSDKRFTLVRYKIACCARDAVPLNAVIMIDPKSEQKIDRDKYRNRWVQVHGRIHFFPKPGSDEIITALIIYPSKDKSLENLVAVMERPPSNPYLN